MGALALILGLATSQTVVASMEACELKPGLSVAAQERCSSVVLKPSSASEKKAELEFCKTANRDPSNRKNFILSADIYLYGTAYRFNCGDK